LQRISTKRVVLALHIPKDCACSLTSPYKNKNNNSNKYFLGENGEKKHREKNSKSKKRKEKRKNHLRRRSY